MAVIEFRTLGTLDLRRTDGPELHSLLAQPKRVALLAYLCVANPRGFHRRDTLLGLFWPDADQAHARTSLRNALHVLRHSLGETAFYSRGDEEVAVNFEMVWCDVVAFEERLASVRVEEVLDLYRGDLLTGFFLEDVPAFERWLDGERTRLRACAARAARVAAERRELERNITGAVSLARRAVELTDTDERAVRRLVELLARIGDRAGALQAYENFARHLAGEFEAEPSAETRALVDRLRNSQSAPIHVLPRAADVPRNVQSFPHGVAGYSIIRELGRGGTSTVFLARDLKHDRPVAIKVLRPEVAAVLGTDRFLAEIALAARLHHPHILPLLDSGKANGLPYYAMPHVEGETLRSRLRRERFLPLDDAILIACEVADALGYAHTHGIIHRDIKPENILLENGHALVTDFGIAHAISEAGGQRLTETGVAVGTAAYMSPEQVDSAVEVDARADIYALACVLYEMLTGDPPFSGSTAQAVLARKATGPAPPMRAVRDTISPDLERNVLRALSRAPADRFRTVKEFADVLRSPKSTEGAAVSTPAGRLPSRHWNRRTVRIAASIAAVIVVTVVIIGVAKREAQPAAVSPVARRVLDFVKSQPSRDPRPSVAENTAPPGSRIAVPAAREAYLRGLNSWSEGSKEGLDTAVVYFRHATELDPEYADAYAGLADAYLGLGNIGFRPTDAMFPKAKAAALRSIQLDSALAPAHAALAEELPWERDFAGAEREFRMAIVLDPTYAKAYEWYAGLLMILGRKPEAVVVSRRAASLDPLSLQIQSSYAVFLNSSGEHATALRQFQKVVGDEPDSAWVRRHPWVLDNMSRVYLDNGQFANAIRTIDRALETVPRHPRALYSLALIYDKMGRRDLARRAFARADTSSEQYAAYRAMLYAEEGKADSAFLWFGRVEKWGVPIMTSLQGDWHLDPVRGDPRYRALVTRLGIPTPAVPTPQAAR
jgi:serine/threonine protein kinase/DNA-binding SARP family transcriptional activator